MSFAHFVLLVQLASTWAMVGLVWFVQLTHYPLFARVGVDSFSQYEADHQRRTTWVVAPLMLAELGSAVLLLVSRPAGVDRVSVGLGLGLLALVWLNTFFMQVPLHSVLAGGFDVGTHRRLVTGNWLRTLAWTLRGLLLLWMVNRTWVPGVMDSAIDVAGAPRR